MNDQLYLYGSMKLDSNVFSDQLYLYGSMIYSDSNVFSGQLYYRIYNLVGIGQQCI